MKEGTKRLELNLRTRAWGLYFDEERLVLTGLNNKLSQLTYKGTSVLEDFESVSDEEVQDFIEEFQNRTGVKRGDAFMVLPRHRVQVQVAEFPPEAADNLEEVMSYQLGNYFPGNLEELEFFPQIISRGDQLKVMIVAVEKAFLGHAFSFIRRWNLKLAGMSLSTFALANGLAKLEPNRFARERTAVFCYFPGHLEIASVNQGKLVSSTLVQLPGEDGPLDLIDPLEQAFSEARLDPNEIEHFLIAGHGHEAVTAYLTETVGIPFSHWEDAVGSPIPPEGLVGLGAAVCSVHDKVNLELNMLPEKLRRHQKRLPLILAVVVLSIMALVFAYKETTTYFELREKHAELETRRTQFMARMNEVAAARGKLEQLQTELTVFEPYEQDNTLYKLLESLTMRLPDHTYLTNLQIKQGTRLQIQGESDNAFEVQRILTSIPYLKDVQEKNAITKRQEKARFIYGATLDLEALREE